MIPDTYFALKRTGLLEKMKESHFVKKHSVQFINQHGKLSEPFYFWDNKPHESSQTWQVRAQRVRQARAGPRPRERREGVARARACWKCCSRATGPSACA